LRRNVNAMVLAGVVLALVAAIGTYAVLRKHVATTQVVVATQYIPPHTQITSSMVAAAGVPASAVPPSAVTVNEPSVGHYSTTAIFPGQVLVAGDLAVSSAGGSAGLLGDLTPGDRAFSIQVSAASAASGDIVPGDQVDVIVVTNQGSGGPGGSAEAATLVQDVTVLGTSNTTITQAAAPQPVSASTPTSSSSQNTSSNNNASVVYTLALTPAQVQLVALAAGSGTLYLALDPVNPTPFSGPPTNISQIGSGVQIGPAVPTGSPVRKGS